jgi:NADH-quinone oxidoreductase subunit N
VYFDAPAGDLPPPAHLAGERFVLGCNAAAVLILGVLPGPLLDLCARLIR